MTPEERKKRRKDRRSKIETPDESTPDTDDTTEEHSIIPEQYKSLVRPDEIIPFESKERRDGKLVTITKYKLRYEAIKKIARSEGLYLKDFTLILEPTHENKFTSYFKVVVGTPKEDIIRLGESSDENTSTISKKYKGMTAIRRGFSRAVLEYLAIADLYGEDEIVEPDKGTPENIGLQESEFEALSEEINAILMTKDESVLSHIADNIKTKFSQGKYTQSQIEYLRKLFNEQLTKINGTEF